MTHYQTFVRELITTSRHIPGKGYVKNEDVTPADLRKLAKVERKFAQPYLDKAAALEAEAAQLEARRTEDEVGS